MWQILAPVSSSECLLLLEQGYWSVSLGSVTEIWCWGSGCFNCLVPLSVHLKFGKVFSLTVLPVVLFYLWTGHIILFVYPEWWLAFGSLLVHSYLGFRIEARREIYGGIGLGVALGAIISMFSLSNVSKVSSSYNLWYTSCAHGRWASKRVNSLSTLNPYVLWTEVDCGSIGKTGFCGNVKMLESYRRIQTPQEFSLLDHCRLYSAHTIASPPCLLYRFW